MGRPERIRQHRQVLGHDVASAKLRYVAHQPDLQTAQLHITAAVHSTACLKLSNHVSTLFASQPFHDPGLSVSRAQDQRCSFSIHEHSS